MENHLMRMALTLFLLAVSTLPAQEAASPLTWETLESRLDQEAESGFSGVCLVVRDGKIVLNKAYGFADRDKKIPTTTETIYAIGSTPIDFTKAGILLLVEQGKLTLTDPITKYFDKVPEDKRAITLEHLMTGRSGLQNFHDVPEDRDPDHGWIDRNAAVKRILHQKLLFEPGKGYEHSHSAWGLLAAVIEIVSGKTYPEFTREYLFKPAAMNDTGFFGESYAVERMAIGYGPKRDGEINAPPYWGPTSWLVMGSGGQTSTVGDMYRWVQAVRQGKILSPDSLKRYFGAAGSVLEGGDMYGFEIVYTDGPKSMMIIVSNARSSGGRRRWHELTEALANLVNADSAPKYTLGVELDLREHGKATIKTIHPGSAAERDGLRPGDILLTVDGAPVKDNPMTLLAPPLQSGSAITFEIERAGAKQIVTVKPNPR